jgi:hypothetical protein
MNQKKHKIQNISFFLFFIVTAISCSSYQLFDSGLVKSIYRKTVGPPNKSFDEAFNYYPFKLPDYVCQYQNDPVDYLLSNSFFGSFYNKSSPGIFHSYKVMHERWTDRIVPREEKEKESWLVICQGSDFEEYFLVEKVGDEVLLDHGKDIKFKDLIGRNVIEHGHMKIDTFFDSNKNHKINMFHKRGKIIYIATERICSVSRNGETVTGFGECRRHEKLMLNREELRNDFVSCSMRVGKILDNPEDRRMLGTKNYFLSDKSFSDPLWYNFILDRCCRYEIFEHKECMEIWKYFEQQKKKSHKNSFMSIRRTRFQI